MACKVGVGDLQYVKNDETGEDEATIVNAPKAIAGDRKNVTLGGRKPVEGATLSPTMASIVKLSQSRFKSAKGETTERSDKGKERAGDAKLGISDTDFGHAVNSVIKMVNAQENKFSPGMAKHLKSLDGCIQKALKTINKK